MAGITGAVRAWTVLMISVYADVRIDRVIRSSVLSELAQGRRSAAGFVWSWLG